jgi:hypothetical protein
MLQTELSGIIISHNGHGLELCLYSAGAQDTPAAGSFKDREGPANKQKNASQATAGKQQNSGANQCHAPNSAGHATGATDVRGKQLSHVTRHLTQY